MKYVKKYASLSQIEIINYIHAIFFQKKIRACLKVMCHKMKDHKPLGKMLN